MRTTWHELWGSADGPATRLAPQARALCGVAVVAVCLTAPATTVVGVAVIAASVLLWGLLCRPPARVVRGAALLGLALFLPYFLLTPLIHAEAIDSDWTTALAVPWAVAFRGLAAMLAGVITATTLSGSALRQALVRLPIPEVAVAIVLQVVHQTSTLVGETRRMAAALAVRSGASRFATTVRVVVSLPQVWLPRVMARAERVAAAMELRGFGQRELCALPSAPLSSTDVAAVGVAALGLAGAVALRLWGVG